MQLKFPRCLARKHTELLGIIPANFSPSSAVNLSPDAILRLAKLSKNKLQFSTVLQKPTYGLFIADLFRLTGGLGGDNGPKCIAWKIGKLLNLVLAAPVHVIASHSVQRFRTVALTGLCRQLFFDRCWLSGRHTVPTDGTVPVRSR